MDRHVENALACLDFLQKHPKIKKIYYPSLDPESAEIQNKQAKNGGAMLSFELDEEINLEKFFSALRMITLAESLGGVESLICHPAKMTHAAIPAATRQKNGITDYLIRLSVGIEDARDIIADLERACKAGLQE